MDSRLATRLDYGLAQLKINASPEQKAKFLGFIELLVRWNKAYNLTATDDPEEMIDRHLLDSLTLIPFLSGDSILDIGSGAGFPGIPLAIALAHKQFVLLDSNGKKTRFLFQVKVALALDNITVENCRVEHYQSQFQIDIVTCRAFASLAETANRAGKLLDGPVRLLAMKGPQVQTEIGQLPADFEVFQLAPVVVAGIDNPRYIVEIRRRKGQAARV